MFRRKADPSRGYPGHERSSALWSFEAGMIPVDGLQAQNMHKNKDKVHARLSSLPELHPLTQLALDGVRDAD